MHMRLELGDIDMTNNVLEAIQSETPRKECEEMFGVSKGPVADVALMNDASIPHGSLKFTLERDQIIRMGYSAGTSGKDITDQCNATPGPSVTQRQVTNRASDIKARRPSDYVKPPSHSMPGLSGEDLAKLRSMLDEGKSRKECCEVLGIDRLLLDRVRRRYSLRIKTIIDDQIDIGRLKEMLEAGTPIIRCAIALGITKDKISGVIRRNNLASYIKLKASKNVHVKVTEQQPQELTDSTGLDEPAPSDWEPGGAQIPISLIWSDIKRRAINDGFLLTNIHDLPTYNRSRIRNKKAPYAIAKMAMPSDKWK